MAAHDISDPTLIEPELVPPHQKNSGIVTEHVEQLTAAACDTIDEAPDSIWPTTEAQLRSFMASISVKP